jgi:hypothetical protein
LASPRPEQSGNPLITTNIALAITFFDLYFRQRFPTIRAQTIAEPLPARVLVGAGILIATAVWF